jgi:hypothetical protein
MLNRILSFVGWLAMLGVAARLIRFATGLEQTSATGKP